MFSLKNFLQALPKNEGSTSVITSTDSAYKKLREQFEIKQLTNYSENEQTARNTRKNEETNFNDFIRSQINMTEYFSASTIFQARRPDSEHKQPKAKRLAEIIKKIQLENERKQFNLSNLCHDMTIDISPVSIGEFHLSWKYPNLTKSELKSIIDSKSICGIIARDYCPEAEIYLVNMLNQIKGLKFHLSETLTEPIENCQRKCLFITLFYHENMQASIGEVDKIIEHMSFISKQQLVELVDNLLGSNQSSTGLSQGDH